MLSRTINTSHVLLLQYRAQGSQSTHSAHANGAYAVVQETLESITMPTAPCCSTLKSISNKGTRVLLPGHGVTLQHKCMHDDGCPPAEIFTHNNDQQTPSNFCELHHSHGHWSQIPHRDSGCRTPAQAIDATLLLALSTTLPTSYPNLPISRQQDCSTGRGNRTGTTPKHATTTI